MISLKDEGWDTLLAVQREFNISPETLVKTCGLSMEEFNTATDLVEHGTISLATDVDFEQYATLFGITKPETTETVTAVNKPVTATKPAKVAKKRGRKGDKIKNAFAAIPTEPTDAAAFIAEHQISMAVLRQSKRFDHSGVAGVVHVRKNKETGDLQVWRSTPDAE